LLNGISFQSSVLLPFIEVTVLLHQPVEGGCSREQETKEMLFLVSDTQSSEKRYKQCIWQGVSFEKNPIFCSMLSQVLPHYKHGAGEDSSLSLERGEIQKTVPHAVGLQ
jgi:hypothetical protein